MQRILFYGLAPALVLASTLLSELPASTFGGSTGPRQSGAEDSNLPKLTVDSNTYRRTKARLSVETIAPLNLPSGSYVVRKNSEAIVEFNNSFELVSQD